MKAFPHRLRIGHGPRERLDVVGKDEADAAARAERLREMVKALVLAGRREAASVTDAPTRRAEQAKALLLEAAGAESPRDFSDVERAGYDLAATRLAADATPKPEPVTYRQIVTEWLDGKIAREHRGKGVKVHTSAKAIEAIWAIFNAHILPLIGNRPIADLTLEDAEKVKTAIGLLDIRDNTFSRYCGLLRRPFKLAVYPLKLMLTHPIPEDFVPDPGKAREGTYLYPEESREFLAATDRSLTDRIVWGFGERNGSRPGEVKLLQVGDVDFVNGTITLDHNKTRSPRQWKAEADVLEALYLLTPEDADPRMYYFLDFDNLKASRALQGHLRAIGLDRRELLDPKDRKVRRPISEHAMRATFVTRAIADRDEDGRPTHRANEHWVRDRTGHTTTTEMDRYRKQARFAAEHEQTTWFEPLTEAIPELARLKLLFLARGGVWPWDARERELRAARAASRATPPVGQKVGQEPRVIGNWARSLFPSPKTHGALKILEGTNSEDLGTAENPGIHAGPPGSEGVGQADGTDQKDSGPLTLPAPLILTKDDLTRALARAHADEDWRLSGALTAQLLALAAAAPDTGVISLADARKRRDRDGKP
jgi:integrase